MKEVKKILGTADLEKSERLCPKPRQEQTCRTFDRLVRCVETALEIELRDFCGRAKGPRAMIAKDVLILLAKARGAGLLELSEIIGIDTSSVSRSYDRARQNIVSNAQLCYAKGLVDKEYDVRNSTQA